MTLRYTNTWYLEDKDFSNGSLKKHVCQGNPVLVLLYSSNCGHCVRMHPEYQRLADTTQGNGIVVAAIDAASTIPSTSNVLQLAPFRQNTGVPTFYLYNSDGSFGGVVNPTKRTAEEILRASLSK